MATRTRGLQVGAAGPDLLGELREIGAQQRADYVATRRSIRDYADLIPEPGFGLLDFERFPYLLDPFYSDEVANAREVVYVKSTQVGASTGLWRWAGREADQFGRTAIYTFPTQDHVNDFGDERIEPAIEGSPYLRSRIPAHFVKTKKLKRIGRGWLVFRGAKSRVGAQSTAAQSLVFDEYDELDRANVAQFERRLSGAKQTGKPPRIRRAGIPAQGPGGPMDRAWRESDQREWMVTCPKCELEQVLSWARNVRWTMPGEEYVDEVTGQPVVYRAGHDVEMLAMEERKLVGDVWRACRDCEASLEGAPILGGRWVAQNPGPPIIGFRIQRLIVADADLEAMVAASRQTAPFEREAFHANDLAEPYSPAEAALTEEDILRAAGFGLDEWGGWDGLADTTAGVDVASERNLNYRIDTYRGGRRQAIKIGEARSFSELETILNAFAVKVCVIDSMPERRLARGLAARLSGRVHLAVYADPSWDPRLEPDALVFDPKKNIVSLNRTMALDAMMDSIRATRSTPTKVMPPGYVEQLQAPRRVTEYDDKERSRRVYRTPSGLADDYAHAEVYALAASEVRRLRMQVEQDQASSSVPVTDRAMGVVREGLDVRSEQEFSDHYVPGLGWRG